MLQKRALELRLKLKEVINEVLAVQKNEASSKMTSGDTLSVSSEESILDLDLRLESVRVEFAMCVSYIESQLDSHVADMKCLMEEKVSWRRHFVSQKEVTIERQRQGLNLVVEQMRRFLETQIKSDSFASVVEVSQVNHSSFVLQSGQNRRL